MIIGFVLSFLISVIAFKKKSLSLDGAITATLLGSFIYLWGGVIPYSAMITFFISSSLISKVNKKKNNEDLKNINEKGSCRDYKQVLANGGVALVTIVLYKVTGDNKYFIATLVSFAASTADTWGSEIGTLFNSKVISIINFKEIQKGLSGGVSLIGTIASSSGALLIAIIYYILISDKIILNGFIIFIFGFIGSIIDSILGALLQCKYIDNTTKKITEKKISVNGEDNKIVQGFSFINNDIVNILSNMITTLLSILVLSF